MILAITATDKGSPGRNTLSCLVYHSQGITAIIFFTPRLTKASPNKQNSIKCSSVGALIDWTKIALLPTLASFTHTLASSLANRDNSTLPSRVFSLAATLWAKSLFDDPLNTNITSYITGLNLCKT